MYWHHRHSISHRRLVLSLIWFAACVFVASLLDTATARAESNEATAIHTAFGIEYAVPNGPRNMVAEGPGRIWYTSTDAGGIGFLEVITDTKVISGTNHPIIRYRTDFYGMGEQSQPYDLDYHDGVVWFTLRGLRALGKIDVATREIEVFTLLSVGAAPTAIDVDPTGQVWIGQNNGRLSRFDPTTETFVEFLMPDTLTPTPRVEDLVYQNDRNIWFTMPDGNRVVLYDSVRDRFSDIPTDREGPYGISLDADGRVWVTSYNSAHVGRFTPTTISIWIWYETPTPAGGPAGILIFDDPLGLRQVWVTENQTGSIGRLQIANGFDLINREKLGPGVPPGNTSGIIRTADGHIWVADSGRNVLYELTDPYIRRIYMTTVRNQRVGQE